MFFGVETQVAWHVAMQQGTGGHHLGVKAAMAGQQPVKITAIPI